MVSCVAWSSYAQMFASGSFDSTVRLWDADTGQCLRMLKGHNKRVLGVAWSPESGSRRQASAGEDKTIRI